MKSMVKKAQFEAVIHANEDYNNQAVNIASLQASGKALLSPKKGLGKG